MKKLVLASHNEGKIKELKLLFDSNIEILRASDFSLAEIAETGVTFEQNALIKAQYVLQKLNLATLADDSGLCVEALADFPGVKTATLAEEIGGDKRDFKGAMAYILNQLKYENNRAAKFVSCLCLCEPLKAPRFFIGEIKGSIAKEPLGENGFGYDAIFIPEHSKKTFGEMSIEEKNSYPTHRVVALTKLSNYMALNG